MVVRTLGASVIALSLLVARAAGAQAAKAAGEAKGADAVGQENFGFGASLGFFNPNGLVLRGGMREASLEVAGGFGMTLLSYGPDASPELKLIAPLEIAPQLVFDFLEFRKGVIAGLRAGYRFNTALGSGATIGAQVGKRWRHVRLEGLWGITVYPKAADRLRGEEVPEGTSFNFPPQIAWGLSVQLLYYP